MADYVSDVPYPRNFVPHVAPATMRLVAALSGHAPPPGDDFDYCELGSGRGDTLATLAAASPAAHFVGIDLAVDHVAFARDLASRGGLANLQVIEGDFSERSVRDATPDFDFIAAHGVLSWVSPVKREALFAYARAKLRPGGVFFLSYNALPGWAVMEPLRRLMLERAASLEGSTLDRARAAYDFARRLAEAKAGYFASHPTALRMLELMKDGGLAYVAHEYFHAHWHPMHFADVEREARAAGLRFAGQVPLYLNVPELALPPGVKELAAGITDRVALEGLKDFAANELFRSDVYVRADQPSDGHAATRFFEATRFGSLTLAAHFKRTVKLPAYSLDFTDRLYTTLVARLAAAPASAEDLARQPELAGLGAGRIARAIQNLTLGGQVVPMRAPPAGAPPSPTSSVRLSPFNQRALDQALAGEGPRAIACPSTGTGLTLSLIEGVLLRLLTMGETPKAPLKALADAGPESRDAWLRRFAEGTAFPLTAGGATVADGPALIDLAHRELGPFAAAMGPKLWQLGILERA